jgi:hypothetical protein
MFRNALNLFGIYRLALAHKLAAVFYCNKYGAMPTPFDLLNRHCACLWLSRNTYDHAYAEPVCVRASGIVGKSSISNLTYSAEPVACECMDQGVLDLCRGWVAAARSEPAIQ